MSNTPLPTCGWESVRTPAQYSQPSVFDFPAPSTPLPAAWESVRTPAHTQHTQSPFSYTSTIDASWQTTSAGSPSPPSPSRYLSASWPADLPYSTHRLPNPTTHDLLTSPSASPSPSKSAGSSLALPDVSTESQSLLLKPIPAFDENSKKDALDANVLAYMDFDDQVITTPNADWVPQYPLIEEPGILKRDDGFWGGHEFTRWPQFFSHHAFHHACIPFHKKPVCTTWAGESVAWLNPPDYLLTVVYDGNEKLKDPRTGEVLYKMHDALERNLRTEFETRGAEALDAGSGSGIPGAKEVYERCLTTGRSALNNLTHRFTTRREILFTIRDIQRAILELRGLYNYIHDIHRVKNKISPCYDTAWWKSHPRHFRGAFTTDPATVRTLYQLGIPVWFISARKSITPSTKVTSVKNVVPWSTCLSNNYVKCNGSTVICGFNFGIEPVLRELASSQLMNGTHMQQLLDMMNSFQFFGPVSKPVIVPPIRPRDLARSPSPVPNADGPKRQLDSRRKSRATPYKAQKGAIIPNEPTVSYGRVLTIPVAHDGTPDLPPFPVYVYDALHSLGTVGDTSSPAALYPLPPPFFLVHETQEKTADLYLNYIRIRPVLFKILEGGGHFEKTVWRKLREWRTILHGDYKKAMPLPRNIASPFIENLYNSLPGETNGKRAAARSAAELSPAKRQRLVVNAGIKVTFAVEHKLEPFERTQAQVWRGKRVTAADILVDKQLRQEIQWELMECLFRYELHALDQAILPRWRMTAEEHTRRNALLSRVYMGDGSGAASVFPDLSKPQIDYWNGDILDHDALDAFREVLCEWPHCPATLSLSSNARSVDIDVMVRFYVKTFVRFFHRIPSMHCKTPDSLSGITS